MGWTWNEAAHRYQWRNGKARFLSRREVMGYVEESLKASGGATDLLAQYVSDGLISVDDWELLMRQEIKKEYIREALLGRGGRGRMTFSDWGKLGSQLKDQYRYLHGFAGELADLSEGQIRARARMYVNSARQAFEEMQQRVAVAAGYDEEFWQINPAVENCPDCLAYYDQGWQPVGTFPTPGDGSTVCLSNCFCGKEYRNSVTGDLFWGE